MFQLVKSFWYLFNQGKLLENPLHYGKKHLKTGCGNLV